MSKAATSASNFLKKNEQKQTDFKESFQQTSLAKRPSIGMPLSVKLTTTKENELQRLLHDYYVPSTLDESSVSEHFKELKSITEEILSISVQSVLLHGERIKKAENVLKDYRDGAFTKWLKDTYGNRQTPYSMLRYYELYQDVKQCDLREKLEAMPKKAVYTLAFRNGSLEKKREIIGNYDGQKQKDLILEIQSTFPSAEDDKRKPKSPNSEVIRKMGDLCLKLRKHDLTDNNKYEIENLKEMLNNLIF